MLHVATESRKSDDDVRIMKSVSVKRYALVSNIYTLRGTLSHALTQACVSAIEANCLDKNTLSVLEHRDHQSRRQQAFHNDIQFAEQSIDTHHQVFQFFWGQSTSPSTAL